jgi:hypothetical protein
MCGERDVKAIRACSFTSPWGVLQGRSIFDIEAIDGIESLTAV